MRRIPILELLRHWDRAGCARGFAPARTFARRGVIPANRAVTLIAAAPGAAGGDSPLVPVTVYGTLGVNGWHVSNVTLNWSFGGPIYSSTAPTWVFDGHRPRLRRGVYRWCVWAGFDARSKAGYGRMLGGSSFVFSHG